MSAEPLDVDVARLRARILWLSAKERFKQGANTVRFKRTDVARMLEIDLALPDHMEAFGGMSAVLATLPEDGRPKWDGNEFVFTDPVINREIPEESEVQEALNYWRKKTRRTQAVDYTASRTAIARARLREGYTVAQLKLAVDRMMESEFHINGGYTDTSHCWKQERIERWLSEKPVVKESPVNEIERVARETIRRRKL